MKENQQQNDFEDVIDLKLIFTALIRRWPLFVASFLVGAILLVIISSFFLPKTYLSSIELYVNSSENKTSETGVSAGEIDSSRKLANTYIVVLKNPAVLTQVSGVISNALSTEELAGVIKMTAVEDTEVIHIAAETQDPALSTKICNAYASIAPGVLQRVVQAGSVEIIGDADTDPDPVSPNVPLNTLIGAFAGLLISIVFSYVAYALDNTVKGGLDLSTQLELPVLGEIPSFADTSKKSPFAKKNPPNTSEKSESAASGDKE
jgi:capsular polysaccharide biosynthesis protein